MTFTHATIGTKVTVRLETQTHAFKTGVRLFCVKGIALIVSTPGSVQSADNIIGVLGE